MNREVFSKKAETPYHPGVLRDTEDQLRTGPPLTKKLTMLQSTPRKTDQWTPPDQQDRLAGSNLSGWGRLHHCSPKDERDFSYMSVAENISYFIDSHSSGKSDLSFRSDVAKPDRLNSSSTQYEQESKSPSALYPVLTGSTIRIFLQPERFKEQFLHPTQQFLETRWKSLSMKEHWNLEKLFSGFAAMPFSHPFRQREPAQWKGMETYQGVMDRWIYDYGRHHRLILSFDFMMTHTSLLLTLIFYWVKLLHCRDDPLLSWRQINRSKQHRCFGMRSLLDILRDYAYYRSRELRSNLMAIKLLNEFYEYAKESLDDADPTELTVRQACLHHHSHLSDILAHEKAIRSKLDDGRDCDCTHLRQVMINYEEKDKMLQDNADDLADLFCELTRRLFFNCPLSRLYQLGEEDLSKKEVADRLTTMSCWLQMLVVGRLKKSRGSGWIGIEYLQRYLALCRLFRQRKNYENLLLFATATMNLRDCIPKLWAKFLQKSASKDSRWESPEQQLRQMVNLAETVQFSSQQQSKEPIVHSNLKILRVGELIKQRYKKDKELVNLNFHESIQEYAKRVLQLRKNLESEEGLRQSQERSTTHRTIKLNLNYRFLCHELYELLKEREQYGPKAYERYRTEARRMDQSIHFPSFLLAAFY